MVQLELGILHYIYIIIVLIVLITMILKRDIVLPCIIGLLIMGFVSSGSIVRGIQTIYNSLIASGKAFWSIIVVISLVVAMSKALRDIGADEIMMRPIKKLMINKIIAFFVLGITMTIISWFIWPSPAVALVGAIMLPAAVKSGLPAMWAAVSMNLFGHGVGLSSDYFIQGAPAISAKAAGLSDAYEVISASYPLWATMSITTISTAFILMLRDVKKDNNSKNNIIENKKTGKRTSFGTYFISIVTPFVFITDIFIMYKYQLRGGDATALVGGTAMLVMALVSLVEHDFDHSLEKVTEYIKSGFIFGIKIFAPVIIIGAFFFLGSETTAKQILGEEATGLLNDIGIFLSQRIPLTKIPIVIMQGIIASITGLDGSGFSGLPLVGSLAQTFSEAIVINKSGLTALGQIFSIWVGGGTLVPWAVIPVAAICEVDPIELARKNVIPVIAGFVATLIVAIIIL